MSRVAVIGTGYVGLTTGACLAHLGHDVVCADIDETKIELLRTGRIPIYEHGLEELVREGLAAHRLSFVVGSVNAVDEAEFIFLCVQTPQGSDGSADLTFVEQASAEIGPELMTGAVVVTKSTVPVGSALIVERALGRSDVAVVSNPEFLREGQAVYDALHPDRLVIGSDDQAAAIRVAALFERISAPLIVTDPATAEAIKYACNAFLATKVSFINAIANLCQAVGADVRDVVLGMGYDKRIGFEFLKPGPGWGGSCLAGNESVLIRRRSDVRLLTLEKLFAEVDLDGIEGWEVLAWRPDDPTPEFAPVAAFTSRPWRGEMVEVRTKLGRRVLCTPDHPFVVGDGVDADPTGIRLAGELTTSDWLPVACGAPLPIERCYVGSPLDGLDSAGLRRDQVIVRPSEEQLDAVAAWGRPLGTNRQRDILRCSAMRLVELERLGIFADPALCGTTTNGTYVPSALLLDEDFWRMLGLWLAEGHITHDGLRARIAWSFHPTNEGDLVEFVETYWRSRGVKVSSRRLPTTHQVSISSRILAGWFTGVLNIGKNCYDKRIPDLIWSEPEANKKALLRGLWDGDGSWSRVGGGPSVVLEFGTVSRSLADGMLRMLGELGVSARLKVGRTAKSTVDTYWLVISGADQIEEAQWLFPPDEQIEIAESIAKQQRRILPTGYRRLNKNASWVRVTSVERRPWNGMVYSLEVPSAGTMVTTGGLVVHNCFPKDSQALVRIAEDHGYNFELLKGVIAVNEEQFELVASGVERLAGRPLEGATVGVWGLTFKAGTDDLRQSPALAVISRLNAKGAMVQAFDPTVDSSNPAQSVCELGIEVCADPYAACNGATVLAVLTEWDEFRWLDFGKVAELMDQPAILDARNLLDPAPLRRRGFQYEGMGRS